MEEVKLKKLKYEYFKGAFALCDFVNKKALKKEDIDEIESAINIINIIVRKWKEENINGLLFKFRWY